MTNHPEIQLQRDDGITQGNIFINGSGELVFREATNGNQLVLNNDGSLKAPANLRLSTGQSIEDGSGTERFQLNSSPSGSKIKTESGNNGLQARDDQGGGLINKSSNGTLLYDNDGGFNAVEYTTSASTPGTLELTNAKLDLSPGGANLRLATGQSIEDGSGTKRVDFSSTNTGFYGSDGVRRFLINDGASNTAFFPQSGEEIRIRDEDGGFNALSYKTSSTAPGTLELTNADLDASGQSIKTSNFEVTENSTTNSLDFNYTG